MSFEQSGLPTHPLIEKAYNLVADVDDAVQSAKILVEECPLIDPAVIAGHLASFKSPEPDEQTLEKEFSARTAEIVGGIRALYKMSDEDIKNTAFLPVDDGVKLSFMALGVHQLEFALNRFGNETLDQALMQRQITDKGMTIIQHNLRDLLNDTKSFYERRVLPLAASTTEPYPSMDQRFLKAYDALEKKLTQNPGNNTGPQSPDNRPQPPSPHL